MGGFVLNVCYESWQVTWLGVQHFSDLIEVCLARGLGSLELGRVRCKCLLRTSCGLENPVETCGSVGKSLSLCLSLSLSLPLFVFNREEKGRREGGRREERRGGRIATSPSLSPEALGTLFGEVPDRHLVLGDRNVLLEPM